MRHLSILLRVISVARMGTHRIMSGVTPPYYKDCGLINKTIVTVIKSNA